MKNKIAAEGARTVPPREHGGNGDIKDLSRGSKVYFPVYVKGAGLSMGDLHFSQGDGEITFCGAIEMAGWLHLKVDLIKGGMAKYGIKNPIFKPSPIVPNYKDYLIFEGISVDEHGQAALSQHPHRLSAGLPERHRIPDQVRLFARPGLRHSWNGALQGHISGVVDIPNACATLYLPTEIFAFDVMPGCGRADQARQGRYRHSDVARQITSLDAINTREAPRAGGKFPGRSPRAAEVRRGRSCLSTTISARDADPSPT